MHLINAVNEDVKAGVVASTIKTRERYWTHWTNFLPANLDPFLQHTDQQT